MAGLRKPKTMEDDEDDDELSEDDYMEL